MAQHQPGLVQDDEAGRPGKALFDAAEQIEQHWNKVPLAHAHQLLDLKSLQHAQRQPICFGIEQLAHRPIDRIVNQRILDLARLHPRDKVR